MIDRHAEAIIKNLDRIAHALEKVAAAIPEGPLAQVCGHGYIAVLCGICLPNQLAAAMGPRA